MGFQTPAFWSLGASIYYVRKIAGIVDPLTPCSRYGLIDSTKFTQTPLLRSHFGLIYRPSLPLSTNGIKGWPLISSTKSTQPPLLCLKFCGNPFWMVPCIISFHWGNIYRDGEVAQPQILNILLISSVILKGEGGQRTSPSLFKILSLLLGQPSPLSANADVLHEWSPTLIHGPPLISFNSLRTGKWQT